MSSHLMILCRGYSDQLSGLSGSLILLVGFLASFPFGALAMKTGRLALITKFCGLMSILSMSLLAYFMNTPNMGPAIVVSCIFMGIFSLGCYPLALELVVECTYPVDQVRICNQRVNIFNKWLIFSGHWHSSDLLVQFHPGSVFDADGERPWIAFDWRWNEDSILRRTRWSWPPAAQELHRLFVLHHRIHVFFHRDFHWLLQDWNEEDQSRRAPQSLKPKQCNDD